MTEIHPTLAMIPVLDEEDLEALTGSIAARGQLRPVVLDTHGRVLDGRGRLKICQALGLTPVTTVYEGDDPGGFAATVNLDRRTLSKGQRAMIAVKTGLCLPETSGSVSEGQQLEVSRGRPTHEAVSAQAGVSRTRISMAFTVLHHAPDLVDPVINGSLALNEAYESARKRKLHATSDEVRLADLRAKDPELAEQVVEGQLTLTGALAEHEQRLEDTLRQQTAATHLILETVRPLAQAKGMGVARLYNPDLITAKQHVTRDMITRAATTLGEIADIWAERGLT